MFVSSTVKQRIVLDSDKPSARAVMGEKPHKLMSLKQAGFPVPGFFTVISDGSGKLTVDKPLETDFGRILEPEKIARSTHPKEGNSHSFSGIFLSVPKVVRLQDTEVDMVNYADPALSKEWQLMTEGDSGPLDRMLEARTFSLVRAYEAIVRDANPDTEKTVGDY